MANLDDKDARAFNPHAAAIEELLDSPIELQVQHAPKRNAWGSLCGTSGGQVLGGASSPLSITCQACKDIVAKRTARRAKRVSR
jgi:hypothetical protein